MTKTILLSIPKWGLPRLLRMMIILGFSVAAVMAQAQIQVNGKVTDETGQGLPGASVVLKGTTVGTTTDSDGAYSLNVQDKSSVLVFSFIGFVTQEITVGEQTSINVSMESDIKTLAEIVVVGYGTMKKSDITGSVVSVASTTLKEVPAPNMLNQLKGRVAGVTIISNGATPGAQGQIRIRGGRTLTTSQGAADALDAPLVVVDGIPFGGLNDINPDDIASMEVLKDASATAIYGSRGAGGVILITTKRGKPGKPSITYDAYHGTTSAMGKYNFMNGAEYAQFKLDAAKYNRSSPNTTAYPLSAAEQAALDAGVSTNWQDEIFQKGFLTNHQIGLQGGSENTQYSVGIGYLNETGIIPNQKFERYTIRSTVDQTLGIVKVGLNSINTLTYTNDAGGSGVTGGMMRMTPLASPYNSDGTVNLFPNVGTIDAAAISPMTIITRKDDVLSRNRSIRTFNSAYAEIKIIDGLRYRFIAGLNFSQSYFGGYAPPLTFYNSATVQTASNADTRNTEFWDLNFQHLLYYDKTFGKHKVNFTALYEFTQNHSEGSSFNVRGVPADYMQNTNFALAAGSLTAGNGTFTEQGLLSYMGRLNYSFNDRYLLTLTMRRDGSSTLSPSNRWFNYPAIGAGWNVSDEVFLKSVEWVSNLKLRASYGLSGNRNVGAYATLGGLAPQYYNFGTTSAGQALGYLVTTLPSADLGWQSTNQFDVGIEFGFLNSRITGSLDYYEQKTKDILLAVSLPPSNGAGSTNKNLGKTQGKGLELALSGDIIRNPNGFSWSVDANYFFNRSEIVELTNPSQKEDIGNGWFVGQPFDVIYDFKKIGIWQTGDAAALAAQTSPIQYPGQIRIQDVNGDNIINAADRQILGNFQPKFEAGLTSRFRFKNFDASIVTNARMGMKVIVPYLSGNSTGNGGYAFFNQGRANQMKVDYWTDTNSTNAFPAPDANNAVFLYGSTLGYHDGSFIKCRSINLGYSFDSGLISKIGMSSARVYVNLTNPFIIYSPLVNDKLAIDPEGNGYGGLAPGAGGTSVQGRQISVNLNNPPVRQFTLGLNVKF
jgi:TonB-linked SusC/RagA family outer membrane protein